MDCRRESRRRPGRTTGRRVPTPTRPAPPGGSRGHGSWAGNQPGEPGAPGADPDPTTCEPLLQRPAAADEPGTSAGQTMALADRPPRAAALCPGQLSGRLRQPLAGALQGEPGGLDRWVLRPSGRHQHRGGLPLGPTTGDQLAPDPAQTRCEPRLAPDRHPPVDLPHGGGPLLPQGEERREDPGVCDPRLDRDLLAHGASVPWEHRFGLPALIPGHGRSPNGRDCPNEAGNCWQPD